MKKNWKINNNLSTYLVGRWGAPYFSINEKGNVECTPCDDVNRNIDLKELLDDLCQRGIKPPILIRFNDILFSRILKIVKAFEKSIENYNYTGKYHGVYPIKVNQQRHVVEELIKKGEIVNLGLEVGSKSEILIAVALLSNKKSLLICNGYKDIQYIKVALDSYKIGLYTILVLDRYIELSSIFKGMLELGILPKFGVRIKISYKGQGRWEESAGAKSKFGLTSREILEMLLFLKDNDIINCLELLHFHIGSQITSIKAVRDATREAMYFYSNLKKIGCRNLNIIDIGGGLAVDYDGSKTNFHSSMNYSIQEYANDVVSLVQYICDLNNINHPDIVSESGRALVAHHSVLIFNLLRINEVIKEQSDKIKYLERENPLVFSLKEAYNNINIKNYKETYNNVFLIKERSIDLFSHGLIDLKIKAIIDDLFWQTCKKIQKILKNIEYIPEELKALEEDLSEIYYCNFSIFQSLPDAWAVGQLFPIMPIHRLNEYPQKNAILADLTCDSDGKIDRFIDVSSIKNTIKLHDPEHKPYYIGVFLIGAYQEILGDLHNLFGDTNAIHVSLDKEEKYKLDNVIEGDSVGDVLTYVEYDKITLIKYLRRSAEDALRNKLLTFEQSAGVIERYEKVLNGYTYLETINLN